MPPTANHLRRAVLGTVGLVLGGLSAIAELAVMLVLSPLHGAFQSLRPRADRLVSVLVRANRSRLVTYLGFDDSLCVTPDWQRAHSYLSRRIAVGLVGLAILCMILLGSLSAGIMFAQLIVGEPLGGGNDPNGTWYDPLVVSMVGLLLLFIAVWGLIGVTMLERSLAAHYLGPSEEQLLRRRVTELATTRAAVVDAINDERRRIERDLHDGVQQRLVALGLLLGRARRATEPDQGAELLRQAHEESQQVLRDLRDVTWRVYPTALDKGGLHTALEGVAERSTVPVRLWYRLSEPLDLPTSTVAYFVASEAVTNALKHGDPTAIEIDVASADDAVVVTVRDDGRGGADAGGSGLSGLASRVAAADGAFSVVSPAGGPTVVEASLPVALVRV